MVNNRLTRQRKIILDELKKVCCHPTAAQIHKIVSKKMPNIGLATVYRNLDILCEQCCIIRLKSKNAEARYDGNTDKHCHLICKKCGKICDIFDVKKINIVSEQYTKSGFKSELDYLEIPGICKKCQ